MIGAIIGDIVGSIYEWERIKTKEFEFFSERCHITDDSVCTAAVGDILLHDLPAAETMQQWCRRYPDAGYGGYFRDWINGSSPPRPYGSYGNGAAMRVSPAAFLNRDADLSAALAAADRVTLITHNHDEGIKGARATVHAIWLAYGGENVNRIREIITRVYGYDLSRSVDDIRPGYSFNATCQKTVPEAITCALESENFEDAVRNAVSLGGDSDTLAAIAGSVAEAVHGISHEIRTFAEESYLVHHPDIHGVIKEMYDARRTDA